LLPAELAGVSGSHLFDAHFRAEGDRLRCADLFARFPLAVLA
jgi:hypothetical protein